MNLQDRLSAVQNIGTRIIGFNYRGKKYRNIVVGANATADRPWGTRIDKVLQRTSSGQIRLKAIDNNAEPRDNGRNGRAHRTFVIDEMTDVHGLP